MRPFVSRRSVLWGGAAGLAASAVPLSPASAATGAFTVATVNLLYRQDEANYIGDLNIVAATGAHLIGVNEAYQYPEAIAAWASQNGFSLWQLPGDRQDNALLARTSDFVLNPAKSGGFKGTGVLGGDKPKPTFTSWANYTHPATGLELYHVNVHLPPKIEANGHPTRVSAHKLRERTSQAARQLRKTQSRVSKLRRSADLGLAEVIVTGDLNIDYRKDAKVEDANFPYRMWEYRKKRGDNKLVSCYSQFGLIEGTKGTHGKKEGRFIDYIYEYVPSASVRQIQMGQYSILDFEAADPSRTHSDHNAVLAPFAINTLARGARP